MTELERCEEIREFVLDNYPIAQQWTPKVVEDWTSWAAKEGFLFLCYEPGPQGKLVGLTIARPLSGERIGTEVADTDFDKEGEVLYVDLTISTAGKQAMQAMMVAILGKESTTRLIAFKRLRTKDKLKVYSKRKFANSLLRNK